MLATQDYDKFIFRNDNRDINWNHVQALVRSFRQYPDWHLSPINVTPDFEIIDGQHRLHAARILNAEFFYVIDYNFESSKISNLNRHQKNLNQADYVKTLQQMVIHITKNFKDFRKNINFRFLFA